MPVSRIIKWQGYACSGCGWENLEWGIVVEHEETCPRFWDSIDGVAQCGQTSHPSRLQLRRR
jgi:hypothetical protein